MRQFEYRSQPGKVLFGSGSRARAADEVRDLGCRAALVLGSPSRVGELREALGELAVGSFGGAAMHTPVAVTERALRVVADLGADCTVAVGGGSVIGLGKAIALRTGLPQLALPTTYAGSEMTPILGETERGVKTTRRTAAVLPQTVIYDVDLTMSLPAAASATSGMNALAHAVEALYARDANPITDLMAAESIRALVTALPLITQPGGDVDARGEALYGAWLAGTCLGTVGMALHHKLCHLLGGSFDLPHAETHSVLLPHVAAYNAAAVPETVATALGSADAATGLYGLAGRLGAPRSLRELGMPEEGIDRAADLAVQDPYWNPRAVDRDSIRPLLARAWAGEPPLPEGGRRGLDQPGTPAGQ